MGKQLETRKARRTGSLDDRFTLARAEYDHRFVLSLDGEVGTGKTHFACTAPAPILIQNIDKGTDFVVEKFRQEGKTIYDESYTWNPGEEADEDDKNAGLQDEAKAVLKKWEEDFYYALANGARTIVWDTESRIWQVTRYAYFGAPNADNPRNYDAPNQRYEAMIQKAKETPGVNLILLRSMKDKWGNYGAVNKQTGQRGFGKGGREIWGYEHLPGMMQLELTILYRSEKEQTDAGDGNGAYVFRFGKCRPNEEYQFTVQPRCSFPQLGALLIEDSTEDDWS
jgi:hypothetical protein